MLYEIIESVKRLGELLYKIDKDKLISSKKSNYRDISTNYDLFVEQELIKHLNEILPTASFYSEERFNKINNCNEYVFIIDPIDGTTNFTKNYGHSCISVGLAHKGEVVLGVVFNPYKNELFCAEKGKGAFLNNDLIRVRNCLLKESLVGYGTCPYNLELTDETFGLAKLVFLNCSDLRRSGSSALDICYTACGKLDLFFELSLFPWDYAAASLIVNESGGKIFDMYGESLSLKQKCSVVAGNQNAVAQFMELKAAL